MATLDDKLLGEKLQNYCSSSEDENGMITTFFLLVQLDWLLKKLNLENDNDNTENDDKRPTQVRNTAPKFISEKEIKEQSNWEGMAQNVKFNSRIYSLLINLNLIFNQKLKKTGPKGVIKDWQRYKQLEHAKNLEADRERRELIKKMAITCRSDDLDKQLEKEGLKKAAADHDENNIESDLLQDEFLQEYLKKRMEEMTKKLSDLYAEFQI